MQHKILLVDDEKHILKILSEALIRRGYIVVKAENGRETVEKAVQVLPDLLILDYGLPDMTGVEVIELLRTHPETLHLPIVLLTYGTPDPEFASYMASYTEVGVVAKIQKPMPPSELLAVVQKAFANNASIPSLSQRS